MERRPILARVRAINLKGREIDAAPSAATLLIGGNATGKTAVREAIVLALMGRHPELGRQGKSILRLAGAGSSLTCAIELTDGRCFESTWRDRGKNTVADTGIELLDAQLDFDTFRRAKPTERQGVLESLLGEDDSDSDARDRERARDLLAEMNLDEPVPDGRDWLSALHANCRETALHAKREAKVAQNSLQELLCRPKPDEGPSPEELKAAQKRREEAIREDAQAVLRLSELNKKKDNAPSRPTGEAPEHGELDALDESIESLEARSDELARVEAEGDRLSARIQVLREGRGDGLAVEHAPSMLADRPTEEELRTAAELWRRAQQEVDMLAERVVQAEVHWKAERSRLEEIRGQGLCPTCGAEGENLAEAITLRMRKYEQEQATQREGLLRSQREAEANAKTCRAHLERLESSATRGAEKARWQMDREIDELRTRVEALAQPRAACARATAELSRLRARRRELRRRLEEWDAYRSAAVPDEGERERARGACRETQARLEHATEVLEELQHRADALSAAREDHRHAARLREEGVVHDRYARSYQQVATWARERMGERAAERMAQLLRPANYILAGLGLGELAIEGTAIGITPAGGRLEEGQPGGGLRPLEVLSGSETTVVATAIQVAIASQAELRLVIVDELNHLTSERKATFLRNLRGALDAGILDQAIALDHDEDCSPEGWERIQIEDVVRPVPADGQF